MGCICAANRIKIIKGQGIVKEKLHSVPKNGSKKRNYFNSSMKKSWGIILDFLDYKELQQAAQVNK